MQTRCQFCGFPFSLSRDTLAAALATMTATGDRTHVEYCPRCRKANKFSLEQIRRFAPKPAPITAPDSTSERTTMMNDQEREMPPSEAPEQEGSASEPMPPAPMPMPPGEMAPAKKRAPAKKKTAKKATKKKAAKKAPAKKTAKKAAKKKTARKGK